MKKLIQIGSLLSFVFLFTVVSANAQTSVGTEVEIPFAFNIGNQSYESGQYIVRLEKYATGSATLSITDTKRDEMQTVILNSNGDAPGTSHEMKLVFDTIDGRRFLRKLQTSDRTYAVVRSRAERDAAKVRDARRSPEASIGGSANMF